jgi:alkylhydroperoxidase family enzyme
MTGIFAKRAARNTDARVAQPGDRRDPVPDEVWDAAARHYSEPQLAALVVAIAVTNMANRVNVTTRQISGEWTAHIVQTARQAA